jgi:catalase
MEHGKVTSVTYRDGGVFCDVRAVRVQTNYENVPVLRPQSGFIQIPKQGEMVAMDQLKDGSRFITHVVSKEEESPDSLREGELSIQLDENTKIHFEKNDDGSHDLHLSASGDVFINGTKQN